jgi:hypothetical protein
MIPSARSLTSGFRPLLSPRPLQTPPAAIPEIVTGNVLVPRKPIGFQYTRKHGRSLMLPQNQPGNKQAWGLERLFDWANSKAQGVNVWSSSSWRGV